MKSDALRIGMSVKHPIYGTGTVRGLTEQTVEIRFQDGNTRTVSPEASALQPAEPVASVEGLEVPLGQFIRQTAEAVMGSLGLQKPDSTVHKLGSRCNGGKMLLHPADTTLQPKEIPIEVFFHKIVMMRNQLRVLEQKINAHEGLSDGEKVEFQQYVTRCYGSMTTFNLLFKEKEDYF